MSENPMADERFRRDLAERIVRDPRTLHVPPGHPYSPIPSTDDVTRALRRAEAAGRTLPAKLRRFRVTPSGNAELIENFDPAKRGTPLVVEQIIRPTGLLDPACLSANVAAATPPKVRASPL